VIRLKTREEIAKGREEKARKKILESMEQAINECGQIKFKLAFSQDTELTEVKVFIEYEEKKIRKLLKIDMKGKSRIEMIRTIIQHISNFLPKNDNNKEKKQTYDRTGTY
jgi:hypothetical protein